jgi:hypothetical protein
MKTRRKAKRMPETQIRLRQILDELRCVRDEIKDIKAALSLLGQMVYHAPMPARTITCADRTGGGEK